MTAALLPDPLWDLVEPFLPIPARRPQGGRPRVSDRACLTGIVFVLRSGIPWQMLPQELGCGSGMTCWRRLRDWQRAGVWATRKTSGEADFGRSFRVVAGPRLCVSLRSSVTRCLLGEPASRRRSRFCRGSSDGPDELSSLYFVVVR